MPSKNMLPKGKRRQTVKHEYRAHRTLVQEREAAARAAAEFEPPTEDAQGFDTSEWMPEPQPQHGAIITTGARGSKVAEEHEEAPRYSDPRLLNVKHTAPLEPVDVQETAPGIRSVTVPATAAGMRLDAFLAKALPEISRARVQLLIYHDQVKLDDGKTKASHKLEGGEKIEIAGEPQPEPLRAEPEDIPLSIVYEDKDLAVIDKPAGMTVHAGSGSAEHNRGTLVNALLFHFGKQLSSHGGDLRPGIVHRLDKETSGLIVVAKSDLTHRRLAEMFAGRRLRKVYLALVHGALQQEGGTVALAIGRDPRRRTRMTTRHETGMTLSLTGPGYPGVGDSGPQDDFDDDADVRSAHAAQARHAVSHYRVLERLSTPFGPFTLVEVHIETGRTHQIRVHMQALGHPVVGDTLYGAPARLVRQTDRLGKASGRGKRTRAADVETGEDTPALGRNFLHAAELDFHHPRTGKPLQLRAALPAELEQFLQHLRSA
jgi:23S rRNA pseudouridine1911/1915/1917 synthase